MAVSFEGYLKLAEFARIDRSLVENHIDGGVVRWLEEKLSDINYIISAVEDDDDFSLRLNQEKLQLTYALEVFK